MMLTIPACPAWLRPPEICHLCGRLAVDTDDSGLCAACRRVLLSDLSPAVVTVLPPGVPVVAALPYRGAVVHLMEAIKLHGHRRPLRFVARDILMPLVSATGGPLVPIPASRHGRRHRGFDQMERLAALMASACGRRRIRAFRHVGGGEQKRLNRTERLEHSRTSLVLRRPPTEAGIILDDVVTTGATVRRAVELLVATGVTPSTVVVVCAVF